MDLMVELEEGAERLELAKYNQRNIKIKATEVAQEYCIDIEVFQCFLQL